MKRNKKNGFTLVELLAVIVILAIILVIAVPKVMSVIEDSKKATLESTAKMIASAAEKAKVQNTVLGKTEDITCDSVAKINKLDYEDCKVNFEENTAKVSIKGSGKFAGLFVCNGDKTEATATTEECASTGNTGVTFIEELLANESTLNNGLIIDDTEDQNIRYAGPLTGEGAVKNKVYFNCAETDGTNAYGSENYNYESSCELWRIIGVLKTYKNENDTEGNLRIKIVKDQVLSTKMVWDTTADGVNYINQWGPTTLKSDNTTPYAGASLMQYLNGDYHNNLTTIAKGQIDEVLWYTGAVTKDTASGVYEDERSNATGTGTTVNYTTKWVGKIGLIYPSDYGYAGTNCGDKTIYDYDASCGPASNWLTLSSSDYWTISPYASNSAASWNVSSGGCARGSSASVSGGVRPALYLYSNIQIIGGEGVDGNAYKLSA